jgi:ribonuclease D
MSLPIDDTSYLTPDYINSLEIISFNGNIHYIDSDNKLYEIVMSSKTRLMGFDTETRPSFKKNIHYGLSLIQIADENDAYIFHIPKIKDRRQLLMVLDNPQIKKIGSGIKDDLTKMKALFGEELDNGQFIDIQKLVKPFHLQKTNLRFLSALFLNKRIIKSSQTSNWHKYPLSEKQLLYAATDAWICLEIYKKIVQSGLSDCSY